MLITLARVMYTILTKTCLTKSNQLPHSALNVSFALAFSVKRDLEPHTAAPTPPRRRRRCCRRLAAVAARPRLPPQPRAA